MKKLKLDSLGVREMELSEMKKVDGGIAPLVIHLIVHAIILGIELANSKEAK